MGINIQILENSLKSHLKLFLHVFNDISTYLHVFPEYFLTYCTFTDLSNTFYVMLYITVHVAAIKINGTVTVPISFPVHITTSRL